MTEDPYWEQTIRRVGNDGWEGEHFEVAPDADGFTCVEVCYMEKDRTTDRYKASSRITVPPKGARLLAAAILACADEIEREEAARPAE